jgi:hypothetical protein
MTMKELAIGALILLGITAAVVLTKAPALPPNAARDHAQTLLKNPKLTAKERNELGAAIVTLNALTNVSTSTQEMKDTATRSLEERIARIEARLNAPEHQFYVVKVTPSLGVGDQNAGRAGPYYAAWEDWYLLDKEKVHQNGWDQDGGYSFSRVEGGGPFTTVQQIDDFANSRGITVRH